MEPKTKTETKTGFASKINWTQGFALVASMLVMFGIDVPVEVQAGLVAVIQGVQAVATWVMRTWFTTKLIK